MTFTGVIINGAGITLAGLAGAFLRKGIPQKLKDGLMTALGLCVLYSGVSGFSPDTDLLVLTASVVAGVLIGTLIDFDSLFTKFGESVQRRIGGNDSLLADGFVSASLFVCVGAMAIVGAIESGTKGTYGIYLAKSFIDILIVFLMASNKGIGCSLAGVVCFVYEALLTLFSGWIALFVNETVISRMSETGSLLVAAIGLNLLNVTHIRIANFILAPFVPVLIYGLGRLF